MAILSARSQRILTVLTILAGALSTQTATVGCKKPAALTDGADAAAPGPSSVSSPQDQADDQLREKLDAYTVCVNTLSVPVHETRARYFAWVDPKRGVTGNEKVVLGLFALPKGAAQKCGAELATARGLPPKETRLEAAGDELARTVTELDTLLGEATPYYETKAYEKDRFALGKSLHPRLVAAFTTFSKADVDLHAALESLAKPLSIRTLASIERTDGKGFRWHRRSTLNAARDVIDAADSIGDEDTIDVARYGAALTSLDKAITELKTFGAGHQAELAPPRGSPAAPAHFDQLTRAVTDYRTLAADYLKCLEAAPATARSANGKVDPEKLPPCPAGKKRDVVTKYNAFVRTSNDNPFP